MAWDLWSSAYDQGNYLEQPGRHSDFYFGYGHDVIEEDALNEKCCVQVLRILITKSDTEIEGLEKDLVSLQNELALAENEKWPEIFCSTLHSKINWLDVSIRSLKSDGADDIKTQLLLHNKPAETLHEIVKSLKEDRWEDQHKQKHSDVETLNPSVNESIKAVDKEPSNFDSNVLIKKEQKELEGTSSEHSRSSKLLLELLEKKSDNAERIELSNIDIKQPCKDATNLSIEKKRPGVTDMMIMSLEVTENYPILPADGGTLCSILDPKEERPDPNEKVKELVPKTLERSPDLDDIRCSPGYSDRMRILGTSEMKVSRNDEVRRSQLITTDTGQILESFSSAGKGDISKEIKQENASVKDVTVNAFSLATGIKGRKKGPDSKLNPLQQVKTENSDLDQRLCDFASKPARRVWKKEVNVAPLTCMNSLYSPSKRQCKRKASRQGVNMQEHYLVDTEVSSSNGSDTKFSFQGIKIQNHGVIDTENSVLSSRLEMQANNGLDPVSQPLDDEGSQRIGHKSEISATISKFNSNLPVKHKANRKRKVELTEFRAREPGDNPVEVVSDSSMTVASKRQLKPSTNLDGSSLNQSPNRKITGIAEQHESKELAIVLYDSRNSITERAWLSGQHEAEELAIVYNSRNSISELQNEQKFSELPIAVDFTNATPNMSSSDSGWLGMDNGNQENLQISCYSFIGSHNETTPLQPSASLNLKDMTLKCLRAIAKEQKVSKYYRLSKPALIEQLSQLSRLSKPALIEQLSQLSSC